MGWERGKYYTRSRKVNGKVLRKYLGCGWFARLCAEHDEAMRDRKKGEVAERKEFKADLDRLAESLDELNDRCDRLARAALVAAGFHQHKRGEWRKKRGEQQEAQPSGDPDVLETNRRRGDSEQQED
jgi:hypothetical protein